MLVTEDGIANSCNEVQSLKAPLSILVTEDGITNFCNEVQF